MSVPIDRLNAWAEHLTDRHAGALAFKELRRAVQALSAVYVEERKRLDAGAALDSAGKRAAFATFYAPLHFMLVERVVEAVGAGAHPFEQLVDLGCGTGPGAAAWALSCSRPPRIHGVEINAWAAGEVRDTLAFWRLNGTARRGDLGRTRLPGNGAGILATYAVNELDDGTRNRLRDGLLKAHSQGARVLIIEPIARRQLPWWDAWGDLFTAAGGRADTWRFPVELPEKLRAIDRAARLDHSVLKARSLYLGA